VNDGTNVHEDRIAWFLTVCQEDAAPTVIDVDPSNSSADKLIGLYII